MISGIYLKVLILFSFNFILFITTTGQNLEWAKKIGGGSLDEGRSIAIDNNGNVYSTGIYAAGVDFDPGTGMHVMTETCGNGSYIEKLDSDGNFKWSASIAGPSFDESESIAVDGDGNVYITGKIGNGVDFDPSSNTHYLNNPVGWDAYILKLDSNGSFLWVKSVGDNESAKGKYITIDNANNICLLGSFTKTIDFNPGSGTSYLTSNGKEDLFVLKLDQNGNFIWANSFGGSNTETPGTISTDNIGNIYATGTFSSDTASFSNTGDQLLLKNVSDTYVQKIDANGNHVWAKSIDAAAYGTGGAIDVDMFGNVYVTGNFAGENIDFDPGVGTFYLSSNNISYFIEKLDNNGDFVWARRVEVGGLPWNAVESISIDNIGNVYTTGEFSYSVDFNPKDGIDSLVSQDKQDVFIQKLDPNGNLIWAYGFGSHDYNFNNNRSDFGNSITTDENGNIYLTGTFEGTIYFSDSTSISSNAFYDIFILKLNQDSCSNTALSIESVTNIPCPNPNNDLAFANSTLLNGTPPYFFSWNTSPQINDSTATFDSSGMYTVTAIDALGCNTSTSVYIEQNIKTYQDAYICEGDNIFLGGALQTNTGLYIDTLQTTSSCDSILFTSLYIYPKYSNTYSTSICPSDSLLINGVYETSAGIYYDSLQTIYGCDSIVQVELAIIPTSIDYTQIQKIFGSNTYIGNFGKSVSIDANIMVIGAPNEAKDSIDQNPLSNAGAAYIFERNMSGVWNQIKKITPIDRNSNDYFGSSVSVDVNFIVVGAYGNDEDSLGNNSLSKSGAAYIFQRINGNWIELKKITAFDRYTNDRFGDVVDISGDYVIIGSNENDKDSLGLSQLFNAGATYMYKRNVDGNWYFHQKITPLDRGNGDEFGYSLSIDGNFVVIGSYRDDKDNMGIDSLTRAGSAYIYEKNSSEYWQFKQKITSSDRSQDDNFGYSVSIDNDVVVIGAVLEDEDENSLNYLSSAGSSYIYQKDSNGIWNEVQKIVASDRNTIDNFGSSVSISSEFIAIGAMNEDEDELGINPLNNSGSVYLFKKNLNGFWNQIKKIAASDRTASNYFGNAVSIDGNTLIIGSFFADNNQINTNIVSKAGAAYIFQSLYQLDISSCDNSITVNGETYTVTGNYYQTLTSSYGCDSLISIQATINHSPNVTINSLISDTLCTNGTPIILQGNPLGGIFIAAGVSDSVFDPSLAGQGSHNIIYTYTDENSCSNNDTINITVELCTMIEGTFENFGIIIYPNPNTGLFTIEKPNGLNMAVHVKLLDATSKLILEEVIPIEKQKVNIDITRYSKGIYYLQLIVNDGVFVKQILKN